MYQTMKVETLSKMVPFFDFSAVERISVDAVKHNFIAMKVDHMKGAIIFGDLVCLISFTLNSFCVSIILSFYTDIVSRLF